MSTSKAFSLDANDAKKIAKGAGIAGGAAVITYLLSALPGLNFGPQTPVIVAVVSVLLNAALKWFQSNQ